MTAVSHKDWRAVPFKHMVSAHARIQVSKNGCWDWIGHRQPNGYGAFTVRLTSGANGVKVCWLAHRLIYSYYRNGIPQGMSLDHLCKNRGCVNPAHLEPVETHENNARSPHPRLAAIKETGRCIKGHPMVEGNISFDRHGTTRRCRTCRLTARYAREPRKGSIRRRRPNGTFAWVTPVTDRPILAWAFRYLDVWFTGSRVSRAFSLPVPRKFKSRLLVTVAAPLVLWVALLMFGGSL